MMPIPSRPNAATQNSNRIARYYLVREIGRGSFGAVYSARDPIVDRNIAIKTCNTRVNTPESKQSEQYFINEARAAGRLNHPNIVTVFDAGNDNGMAYIAMEYLQGTELGKLNESGKVFSTEEVAAISLKLADAMAHVHKNGVVHRDINPSNIFMVADTEPKIFDFGIARFPNRLQDQETEEEGSPHTLFRNNLLGTPNYMSPEQATGKQVDHLTDIYSLGTVMYELLTQRKPFKADTTAGLLELIAYKAPEAPHEINPAIPLVLSQIVMKAMSKRPEKRYQNAEEMALDISRFQRGASRVVSTFDEEETEPEAKPRSPALIAGISLLAVLAAGAYYFLR
jgi:eukaryotic-like serine/threonine-protein kinase